MRALKEELQVVKDRPINFHPSWTEIIPYKSNDLNLTYSTWSLNLDSLNLNCQI